MTRTEQRDASPRRGLTKACIASAEWYTILGEILGDAFTSNHALALTNELVARLRIDSALILHYPGGGPPRLLHERTRHQRRTNRIDDYLLRNYALDPFYLLLEHCSQRGFISLRELTKEKFSSSEYYKAHYRSAGLLDEVCFCCGDGIGGYVNLSLGRAIGGRYFGAAELEAARCIAPLITAALQRTWRSFSADLGGAAQVVRADHHRRIENARLNFGRSVLTDREFEILQFLLRGKSIEFIARCLGIAVSTIKVHRKHIYSKLGISSQGEMFALFLDAVVATECESGSDPLASYGPTQRSRSSKGE